MAKRSDADYLKSEEIGQVIAKGMGVLYNTNPKNPVDFLAKWLLNYSQVERAGEKRIDAQRLVHECKQKHMDDLAEKERKCEAESKCKKDIQDEKEEFLHDISESKDLNDELQSMVDHLKKHTGATAVYVGRLVSPKKPITDLDDDAAHVDDASEKMISFTNASSGSEFMVDQVLKKGQGMTFDVFEDKLDEEGKPIVLPDPSHFIVPEVVR